jgi:hypothetical protein
MLTEETQTPRRRPIRRIGCTIALVIWFTILLLPCFLIVFAVQQQIVISQGGAPGQELRIWLISEAEQRGFGVSSTSVRQTNANALCVQTDVRFLLWAGSADPVNYCDCYERTNAESEWSLTNTSTGVCSG